MKVGIVGATGLVGRKFIELLEEREFPIEELHLFASERSKGKLMQFKEDNIEVESLAAAKNMLLDVVFVATGSDISRQWVPLFLANGATVIDNSSCWRMEEDVPLVVPEVNYESIKADNKLIANPNCVVSQLVVALKPIFDNFTVEEIFLTSLQSVSGAGTKGIADLTIGSNNYHGRKSYNETEGFFIRPIAHNLIPQIGSMNSDGVTGEEEKVIEETRKIFSCPDLKMAVTCVRVPVYYGHSISITVKVAERCTLQEFVASFRGAKGIAEFGLPSEYITPRDLTAEGAVHVGRIRQGAGMEGCFSLWVVADNLLKGAALNAIQIAESLFAEKNAAVRGVY